MKIKIFIITVFITILSANGICQTISEADKQQVLQNLQFEGFIKGGDSLWLRVFDALRKVEKYKIVEATAIIKSEIWSCDGPMVYVMMKTLYYLHDPDVLTIIKAIIDTAESILAGSPRKNQWYFENPKATRHDAILQLFDLGDFTYVDKFVQDITEKGRLEYPDDIAAAGDIIKLVPSYRDFAKTELLKVMYTDTTWTGNYRGQASREMRSTINYCLPELTTFFANAEDYTGNNWGIAHDIAPLKYPPFADALKSKLSTNKELVYHDDYMRFLLKYYGTPSSYQFMETYTHTQQDSSLIEYARYMIHSFEPDTPSVNTPVSDMLDMLMSYTQQCSSLGWLGNQAFVTQLTQYITMAKTPLLTRADSLICAQKVMQFKQAIDIEYRDVSNATSNFVTLGGWKFLYYNAQYILDRLPQIPPSGCNVKLVSSVGTKLTSGALQYYESAWKDAVNNNDGTFFINTTKTSLSLRMTYEYSSQTKSNVTVGYDTVVFQTVDAQIQLQNSNGTLIDTGSVQYYAGAWRTLGTTISGTATKELLPATYSFRMTYAYASKDKQQDIGTNPIVVFQTVNAAVQLQNSQGTLIDQGTVQYYSGAWRDLGTTTNGVANKELLPNNYSFRMTYAYASKDKQQDLSTNPTVIFQTVNAAVQLKNSLGNLVDHGTVQYYSGAWRELGTTTNGVANKELLPNNYSFRMTYAYASKDKQQDLSTNATVVFQTVNAAVQLKNSLGNLIDQGTVQYYSGAWRTLGTTTNGTVAKELLPNNYSFRMTYKYASLDKAQDISTNNTVSFSTVLCTIRVKNSQNQLVDNAMASYYSGTWRQIGNTVNGIITKELLPVNLSFRVKYGTQQQDKQQNLSTNSIVEFSLP
jgi:formylmethanofuran dehydrogenase subunit C